MLQTNKLGCFFQAMENIEAKVSVVKGSAKHEGVVNACLLASYLTIYLSVFSKCICQNKAV